MTSASAKRLFQSNVPATDKYLGDWWHASWRAFGSAASIAGFRAVGPARAAADS
jgi:hypothetical protein